jgi:hypothetical protein
MVSMRFLLMLAGGFFVEARIAGAAVAAVRDVI